MRRTAVLVPHGPLWRFTQLCHQSGVSMVEAPLPDESLDLHQIAAMFDSHRLHLRFEEGKLFVGTNDEVYDISGVPHCGNRYVSGLLSAFGVYSTITHLTTRQYPYILPIRNPAKCLLSHWKKSLEIEESFIARFVAMWDRLEEIKDGGTVFFVDRDPPDVLLGALGIEGSAPEVSKHAHFLSDQWVSMTNPPQEVRDICKRWGY